MRSFHFMPPNLRVSVVFCQCPPVTEFRLNMLMASEPKTLGEKLKFMREKRDLKLPQVAARTGIAYSTLADMEATAQDKITAIFLLKLAKVYNVTVEELIRGGEPAAANPAETVLSPDELVLIQAFRNGNASLRQRLLGYVDGHSEAPKRRTKKTKETARPFPQPQHGAAEKKARTL